MNNWQISRRTMLKGLGATLALPLLEAMRPLAARAVNGVGDRRHPVRLAVLYMPNGVNPHAWTPAGAGRDFHLSPILEPLTAYQSELLVLSQLWNAASDTGDGHYVKTGGFLTGTTITRTTGADVRANGISMDQLCAQRIGHLTPLPSLELGIEPPSTGVDVNVGYTQLYGAHIAWSSPTTPLAKEINPKLAFDRMFRGNPANRRAEAAGDRSVIDLVLDDARRLQGRLGRADRLKLNEYLESVRAVERRIEFDAERQRGDIRDDPLARRAVEDLGRRVDPYGDPGLLSERRGNHTGHVRLMLDLIALAFWADATRVATFMFGNAVSGRSFSFLGNGIGSHHQTSHHEDDPVKLAQYKQINRWHVVQYAYLIEKLKSIPEGQGTLLDNCMILLGAGMRDGNAHSPKNLPLLLAGRGGGTLATGRHVAYQPQTPLSNLYRSMLLRMGTPTDHFADSTGELPGLDEASFRGPGGNS